MLVQFYIAGTKITLKERTKLKGFIISIFLKEGKNKGKQNLPPADQI